MKAVSLILQSRDRTGAVIYSRGRDVPARLQTPGRSVQPARPGASSLRHRHSRKRQQQVGASQPGGRKAIVPAHPEDEIVTQHFPLWRRVARSRWNPATSRPDRAESSSRPACFAQEIGRGPDFGHLQCRVMTGALDVIRLRGRWHAHPFCFSRCSKQKPSPGARFDGRRFDDFRFAPEAFQRVVIARPG